MKKTKAPIEEQIVGGIGEMFSEIVRQILVTAILIGYFVGCVWFFDHFGIRNPDTQLAWVLAPVVLGGLAIAVYLIRKTGRI